MKLSALLGAVILLATGAVARAQPPVLAAPVPMTMRALDAPGVSAPVLTAPTRAEFAGKTATSFSLSHAAPRASGLQLNRTSGHDAAWANFASGTGNLLFLGAGTLLPLVEDGKDGGQHALRTADSLLVSALLAEGLKRLTHEQRPDGTDHQSFPSGHATAAFTVATLQAHYHPGQAIFWYAGATLIGASRVRLRRHYTHDVIAGAALGYATARLELGQNRGLLLRPFIRSAGRGNRVGGLSFSKSF